MSREIKFRAWEKETTEPFPWKGAEQDECILSIDNDGTIDAKSLDDVWGDHGEHSEWVDHDVEVEQFIGLQDKNGKGIYEGDIIRFTEEDTASFVGPVEYMADDDYPAFDIPDKYIPEGFYIESNVISNGVARGILEVIGNVHENPDLLEVKK